MQENQLGDTKYVAQNGKVSFLIFLSANRGATWAGRLARFSHYGFILVGSNYGTNCKSCDTEAADRGTV